MCAGTIAGSMFPGTIRVAGSMVSGTIAGSMVSGTIAGSMVSGTIAGAMISGTIAGAILVVPRVVSGADGPSPLLKQSAITN